MFQTRCISVKNKTESEFCEKTGLLTFLKELSIEIGRWTYVE